MLKLRLKAIRYNCDFRKNENSLYNEFKASQNFPGELAKGEAYLFVSASENQLIWFLNATEVEAGRKTVGLVDSRRWRLLSHSKWHPMMLANYASDAGIELIGIRRFEEAYRSQRHNSKKEAACQEAEITGEEDPKAFSPAKPQKLLRLAHSTSKKLNVSPRSGLAPIARP